MSLEEARRRQARPWRCLESEPCFWRPRVGGFCGGLRRLKGFNGIVLSISGLRQASKTTNISNDLLKGCDERNQPRSQVVLTPAEISTAAVVRRGGATGRQELIDEQQSLRVSPVILKPETTDMIPKANENIQDEGFLFTHGTKPSTSCFGAKDFDLEAFGLGPELEVLMLLCGSWIKGSRSGVSGVGKRVFGL